MSSTRQAPALRILLAAATLIVAARAQHPSRALAAPPPDRIAAPAACYVRLPDLPAPRYSGFGGYNADSTVIAYSGGATKLQTGDTVVHSDLYTLKLDGLATAWRALPSGQAGYNRARGRGCRAMTSVSMAPNRWLSVFGKDGCDNGRVDRAKRGGDVRALDIGATTDAASVRWAADLKLAGLPNLLAAKKGRLMEPFAGWDAARKRLVFGHGTFDDVRPEDTRGEVYVATQNGAKLQIREIKPVGPGPTRRWGSCGAYIDAPEHALDGMLVVGGQAPGMDAPMLAEAWWLDFSGRDSGAWHDVTARIANQAEFGPRRSGACAFDAESLSYYWWMGRGSKDVPDGAKRSGGLWRLDLSNLADPAAPLAWERLAPDDLAGFAGRQDIPSIWDSVQRRMLVLGGRNGDDVLADAWAVYPDIGPETCPRVDPRRTSPIGEAWPAAPDPSPPADVEAPSADAIPPPDAVVRAFLPTVQTDWRPRMSAPWPGELRHPGADR